MCALCGAFGAADHWTDGTAEGASSFAERRRRANAANRLLALHGLSLAAWGSRFTLAGRTGRTAIVEHFGALWPEAERLAGRPCDPLDPATIAAVEALAESR